MKKILILASILILVLTSVTIGATYHFPPGDSGIRKLWFLFEKETGGSGVYENLSIDSVNLTIDGANVRTEQ